MQIDKRNGDVCFNEELHIYFNTKYLDRKYISVTTLIGKYHQQFDEDFWSSYKALEQILGVDKFKSTVKKSLLNYKNFDIIDLSKLEVNEDELLQVKADILESYKKANRDACERGTIYHKEQEELLYRSNDLPIEELGLPLPITGLFPGERHNFDLNFEKRILPEYLIYYSSEDGILNIAGQMDVLLKDGNDLHIVDYKTNAKGIEMSSYFDRRKKTSEMMFYPLNHLEDCSFQHYTIQLSLYAWMLQKVNPEFNIKSLTLAHIDGNGKKTNYPVEYIKDDITKLLKHYKKQLVIEHYRKTGKMHNEDVDL